jgi:UDP-GlcNAc3NAcA epimerase
MKIVTVVGARPQFIKAATVSRAFSRARGFTELIVHTGQHYDDNLSDIFFRELEIPAPARHLGVGSGTHGAQTGRMLEAIEIVLLEETPNLVLVYGDTNSTLAGALAATKLHIPVAHVEAGLRSFNRRMPEEVNRVLTDHAADLLFAPTMAAVANLAAEGIDEGSTFLSGDVMYDAALFYAEKAESESTILEELGVAPGEYILATAHRAENTDDPVRLDAIFTGLASVASDLPVVMPLHPRTQAALREDGGFEDVLERIEVIPPAGYLDMVTLETNARLIVTDSGGVQKEAFFYGVPCMTLREETEWVELVDLGWNRLVAPTSPQAVRDGIKLAMAAGAGKPGQPYGDGHAAERIVRILASGGRR